MLIVDAHLDLAMNALEWNRDLTRPVEEIRARESGLSDKPDRCRGTVSFPEMRRGGVGLCVATQIARYVAPGNPLAGWHSPEQAWAMTQGQLAWYRAMEERGELTPILDLDSLERHLRAWPDAAPGTAPIGYVLSLEGADSMVTIGHLERAYAYGLRAVGPAHYGPGVYAQGTNATGVMGPRGHELLREMERLGIILDATHLCDDSFRDALDHFGGYVWASHSNSRTLVPHNRQFSDDQIRELIGREAVISVAFDAWMLVPGWERGKTTPEGAGVSLATVADHIDHICQIAGNARHCGIGSDLDGAFGREQCPADVHSIADLSKLPGLLAARGYSAEDVANIAHGNFVRFLRHAWS
jgi:membrane dipeptidase